MLTLKELARVDQAIANTFGVFVLSGFLIPGLKQPWAELANAVGVIHLIVHAMVYLLRH